MLEKYIRVTDVLYPLSGLQKVPVHIVQNASERGSKVHDICDALISNMGIPNIDPEIQGYIQSFESWSKDKCFIDRPSRFYCDDYLITGECDGIYEDKTGLVLFDIKTPAKESKTWSLQGSAYSYLAKKSGYNISRIEFIQLNKKGENPKIHVYQEDFELFLSCLKIYKLFFKDTHQEEIDYL
jgi:hypothetical protein